MVIRISTGVIRAYSSNQATRGYSTNRAEISQIFQQKTQCIKIKERKSISDSKDISYQKKYEDKIPTAEEIMEDELVRYYQDPNTYK